MAPWSRSGAAVGDSMPPHCSRTITVDRLYLDTAESAHTSL